MRLLMPLSARLNRSLPTPKSLIEAVAHARWGFWCVPGPEGRPGRIEEVCNRDVRRDDGQVCSVERCYVSDRRAMYFATIVAIPICARRLSVSLPAGTSTAQASASSTGHALDRLDYLA